MPNNEKEVINKEIAPTLEKVAHAAAAFGSAMYELAHVLKPKNLDQKEPRSDEGEVQEDEEPQDDDDEQPPEGEDDEVPAEDPDPIPEPPADTVPGDSPPTVPPQPSSGNFPPRDQLPVHTALIDESMNAGKLVFAGGKDIGDLAMMDTGFRAIVPHALDGKKINTNHNQNNAAPAYHCLEGEKGPNGERVQLIGTHEWNRRGGKRFQEAKSETIGIWFIGTGNTKGTLIYTHYTDQRVHDARVQNRGKKYNGIFVLTYPGTFTLTDSEIDHNGPFEGHGVYLDGKEEAIIRNNLFHGQKTNAHQLKCYAAKMTIEDNIFMHVLDVSELPAGHFAKGRVVDVAGEIAQGFHGELALVDITAYGPSVSQRNLFVRNSPTARKPFVDIRNRLFLATGPNGAWSKGFGVPIPKYDTFSAANPAFQGPGAIVHLFKANIFRQDGVSVKQGQAVHSNGAWLPGYDAQPNRKNKPPLTPAQYRSLAYAPWRDPAVVKFDDDNVVDVGVQRVNGAYNGRTAAVMTGSF